MTAIIERGSPTREGVPTSLPSEHFEAQPDGAVVRVFKRRDGKVVRTPMGTALGGKADLNAGDLAWLMRKDRPDYPTSPDGVRAVDLFAGCGGLSLGFAEACRATGTPIASLTGVDLDEAALDVFESNLPASLTRVHDVGMMFDGALGTALTAAEEDACRLLRAPSWVLAGPPCQGFSSLNNHTRGTDEKNALYRRAARAVEVLRPEWALIENVASVRQDPGETALVATRHLRSIGYEADELVVPAVRLGVAQTRRRHLLLASRIRRPSIEEAVAAFERPPRDLEWAIGDLARRPSRRHFDQASTPSTDNRRRMAWLLRHGKYDLPNERRPECHAHKEHTYLSMYGRLRWDAPAQTITSGYGSMGQGRYVHPNGRRTLTPHEAARLQSFPDFYDFGERGRGDWATLIGNAVPMMLSYALAAWALG